MPVVGRPCARMGELRVWDVVEGVLILCGFEGGKGGEMVGGVGCRLGVCLYMSAVWKDEICRQ